MRQDNLNFQSFNARLSHAVFTEKIPDVLNGVQEINGGGVRLTVQDFLILGPAIAIASREA